MGLYDRDYMREPQGRNDPYFRTLRRMNVTTTRRGRSTTALIVVAALTVFGMWVLPHFTINGHHYRFWIF